VGGKLTKEIGGCRVAASGAAKVCSEQERSAQTPVSLGQEGVKIGNFLNSNKPGVKK